ncbi:MAG: methyltransferase domain-containing protein [Rubrivivax sp.]|nr:methyltransferase domain-containing protein [Rubrivivax sp.]
MRALSLAKYRRHAERYDRSLGPTWPIRQRAVQGLGLRAGQRVLDVGCGTGMSLALLRSAVGEQGHVYGVDQSPEMLARARALAAPWPNVTLVQAAAHELRLPEAVDAVLFHYTHDILRSPCAIEHVLRCARPGARVAVAGIKYFARWLAPLNLWVYFKNHGYNGAPGQLARPWDRIAPHLAGWQLTSTQFGMGYLAFGTVRHGAAGVAAAPAADQAAPARATAAPRPSPPQPAGATQGAR